MTSRTALTALFLSLFFLPALFLPHLFWPTLSGQVLYFEESFDQWSGTPPVLAGWVSLPANNCQSGGACYWGPEAAFDPSTLPAPAGCDGGGYARAATSQLGLGQAPSLLSPILDLSGASPGSPLSFHFCLVNPSTQAVDGDGIQVSFSADGGSTWSVQLLDFNAYSVWTERVLPVPAMFRTASFRLRFDALGHLSSGDIGLDGLVIQDSTPVCTAVPSQLMATGDTSICRDQVADWVYFTAQAPGSAAYAYLLTDPAQQLISVLAGDSLDFNELPPAQYRVYGISYTGQLQATPGLPISTVEGSLCHHLSHNYAEVRVRAVSAQIAAVSDYNGAAISVYGASDGALLAEGEGGLPPYTYAWQTQPPQSGATAIGLPAGTYEVKVTDARGCAGQGSFTLSQPTALQVHLDQPDSSRLRCAGDSSAHLRATVSGGVPPYAYAWSPSLGEGERLTGLPAGGYVLQVSDANGAQALASYVVTSPLSLTASVEATPPRCGPGQDGQIALQVAGGQPPYAYAWAHGPATPDLSGLAAGRYTCTVTDSAGCALEVPVTLDAAPPLEVEIDALHPDCAGTATGWLAASASGGQPPYAFHWERGDSSAAIFELPAGTYRLTLRDSGGCGRTATAVLVDPPALHATAAVSADNGQGSGSIRLTPQAGTPPYSVSWDDGAQGPDRSGLRTGAYSATLTDAQGCSARLEVAVPETATLECLEPYMGFTPNGDGVNDRWVIPCLDRFPQNELTVFNQWGQEVLFQENYQNDWDGTRGGKALPAGTYYFLLKLNGSTDQRLFKGTLSLIR